MFQHGGIDISHVRVDVAGDCYCLCNVPVLLSSVYAEPRLARAHGARDMDGQGYEGPGPRRTHTNHAGHCQTPCVGHKRRSCQTPATERLHGKDRALKTRWGSRVAGSHEGSHVCNLVCVCQAQCGASADYCAVAAGFTAMPGSLSVDTLINGSIGNTAWRVWCTLQLRLQSDLVAFHGCGSTTWS